MRLMTWNIHGGLGSDWRWDLPRIVEVIQRHAPDIVALQEVDSRRTARAKFASPAFEYLAEAIGTHIAEARLITAPDGDYGHVLISKWPFVKKVLHDISFAGREPRATIEAWVNTPDGPLHILAAHLGLRTTERQYQLLTLERLCLENHSPSVLLGDFNDWIWRGKVQEHLSRLMPARSLVKTFPAFAPAFAIDRIYVRPATALLRSWTDRGAWRASDHLPVIADIRLNGKDRDHGATNSSPRPFAKDE
jgi:endonuclease/exonuclease/phosphatase family metal-dependent hydrolase